MSFIGSHGKARTTRNKAAREADTGVDKGKGKGRQEDSLEGGEQFESSDDGDDDGDDDDDDDDDNFEDEEDESYASTNTYSGTTPATTTQLPSHPTSSSITPPAPFSPRHPARKSGPTSSGPFSLQSTNDPATPNVSAAPSSSSSRSKKKKRRLDVVANAVGVYLSPASSSAHSKISCSECRASKTRCSGGEVCERCRRLQRECVYKEHRRGHFSDNPRIQHLEQTISTLLTQIRTLQSGRDDAVSATSASASASNASLLSQQVHTSTSDSSQASSSVALPSAGAQSFQSRRSKGSSSTTSAIPFNQPLSPAFAEPAPIRNALSRFSRLLSSPLELLAYSQSQVQRDTSTSTPRPSRPDDEQSSLPGVTNAVLLPSVSESKHDYFCPIDKRILTMTKAEALLSAFMTHINPQVALLDPNIHSIAYIRSKSSFLLTVVCYAASLFDADAAPVSRDLEQYLQHAVLPAILTTQGGYRSVEIVQAFVLLAHYYPATDRTSDDRSWHYIGHAARIGAELGLNQVVHLNALQRADEGVVRRLRNRQRAWLGVWLCEMVLCEQFGRVPLLRVDPLIVSTGTGVGWQGDTRFTLSSDVETVSRMQMHMIVLRQMELYERVLVSATPHVTPATATTTMQNTVQQAYDNATRQLDAWLATWMHVPSTTSGTAAGGAAEANVTSSLSASQVVQRQARARLTYWYVKILLAMRAVQFFAHPPASAVERDNTAVSARTPMATTNGLYRDALQSCLSYLSQYVGLYEGLAGMPVSSTPADSLTAVIMYGSNVTVVAPAFCGVVCLHILTRSPTVLAVDERISVPEVFALVLRAADAMMVLSAVTAQRASAGTRYGPLLRSAVAQARTEVAKVRSGDGQQQATTVGTGGRRRKETGRGKSAQQQQQREYNDDGGRRTRVAQQGLIGTAMVGTLHAPTDVNAMGMDGSTGGGGGGSGGMMDVSMSSMLPPSYPLYGHSDLGLPQPPPALITMPPESSPIVTGRVAMAAGHGGNAQPPAPLPPWDSLAMHYPWPPMDVSQGPPSEHNQAGHQQQALTPQQQPSMLPHPQPLMVNASDESLHHLLFSSNFYSPAQPSPSLSATTPARRPPTPPPGP